LKVTTETTSDLTPEQALRAARDFFLGPGSEPTAWLETESDTHLSLCTFRGNLAIAVFEDPAVPTRTRVRITTLREEGLVPRLIAHLDSASAQPAASQ
jgi:hypothetical protein